MTLSALHVSGRYIRDVINNTVILRGVCYGYSFVDQNNSGAYWFGLGWNPTKAGQILDIIRSWGANIVRLHESYDWMVHNTVDPVSGLTHFQIVKALAQLCDSKGLYLFLDGYSNLHAGVSGYQQDPLSWPPYTNAEGAAIIPNAQAWIDAWVSLVSNMGGVNNLIIELHNEPHGNAAAQASWFTNLQPCITAIRNTGWTGLIVYQWDYGCWINLSWPPHSVFDPDWGGGDFRWVRDYPLTDPTGNLVVSTHQYWDAGHLDTEYRYSVDSITTALYWEGFNWVLETAQKPIIIGELGANRLWANQTQMQTAFANQLQVYANLGISYTDYWFRAGYIYGLFENDGDPNGSINQYGIILQNALAYQVPPVTHRLTVNSSPQNVPFTIRKIV